MVPARIPRNEDRQNTYESLKSRPLNNHTGKNMVPARIQRNGYRQNTYESLASRLLDLITILEKTWCLQVSKEMDIDKIHMRVEHLGYLT